MTLAKLLFFFHQEECIFASIPNPTPLLIYFLYLWFLHSLTNLHFLEIKNHTICYPQLFDSIQLILEAKLEAIHCLIWVVFLNLYWIEVNACIYYWIEDTDDIQSNKVIYHFYFFWLLNEFTNNLVLRWMFIQNYEYFLIKINWWLIFWWCFIICFK